MSRRQRIKHEPAQNTLSLRLIESIVRNETSEVAKALERLPSLAKESLAVGAAREAAHDFFFHEIRHYVYAGDTLLHVAAAGYRGNIAKELLRNGANVSAVNRRGAAPLHYAADGFPGSPSWNPKAQAEIVSLLIDAGADPNARDKSGVAPLHRAVRQRCAGAVEALLRNGASCRLKNKSGSTPLHLAVQNTGKGGTGSPGAKAQQREIVELLLKAGASPKDRDGLGKTVAESVKSDWIRALL